MAPNTSLRWMPVAIAGLVLVTTVSLALGARDIRVFVRDDILIYTCALTNKLGFSYMGSWRKATRPQILDHLGACRNRLNILQ